MKYDRRSLPESFRGRSLSVSLTVKDLKASVAWYRNVLGFTLHQKHEREGVLRAVSLQAGNVRILIGQDDGAKGWDRAKGEGFSMMITTAQDIDEVAKGIKQRGGALENEPTIGPTGARFFRVRDPDGFRYTVTGISQSDA
jgi:catechol 2,3-dioxygenase-like lactoylglutathione lyase family enzyme